LAKAAAKAECHTASGSGAKLTEAELSGSF